MDCITTLKYGTKKILVYSKPVTRLVNIHEGFKILLYLTGRAALLERHAKSSSILLYTHCVSLMYGSGKTFHLVGCQRFKMANADVVLCDKVTSVCCLHFAIWLIIIYYRDGKVCTPVNMVSPSLRSRVRSSAGSCRKEKKCKCYVYLYYLFTKWNVLCNW